MSKAQNRKARLKRRGRPRDEECEREPNGRKDRALRPRNHEDARMVAIEARMRQYGVSHDIASHEKAGTILGLLWLQKLISEPLREAGELVAEYHRDMLRATQAPDSLATRGPGASGDTVSDEYISWAIAAVAKWNVAKEWLASVGALDVFERVVLRRNYPESGELVALNVGLQYLARRMGLDNSKT